MKRELITVSALAALVFTWTDEGTPSAVFRAEDIVYNAEVQDLIRLRERSASAFISRSVSYLIRRMPGESSDR